MVSKNKELTEVLNTLIKINIDRTEGYEKAMVECKENFPDLQSLFFEFADQSRGNISVLKNKVLELGAEAASHPTLSGKIYSLWTDIKWTFTGVEREGILQSCAVAEEAAQAAYDHALSSDAEMSAETRQMLISQKESMNNALERINSIRKITGVNEFVNF